MDAAAGRGPPNRTPDPAATVRQLLTEVRRLGLQLAALATGAFLAAAASFEHFVSGLADGLGAGSATTQSDRPDSWYRRTGLGSRRRLTRIVKGWTPRFARLRAAAERADRALLRLID